MRIIDISSDEGDLEDVFVKLTKHIQISLESLINLLLNNKIKLTTNYLNFYLIKI